MELPSGIFSCAIKHKPMHLLHQIKDFLHYQESLGGELYRVQNSDELRIMNYELQDKVQKIESREQNDNVVPNPQLQTPNTTKTPNTLTSLADLEAFMQQNILTPIDATRKNLVFGVGNPQATLMVIGEAPGADEDAKGEPFVGKSGQLLTKILSAVNFNRADIYIANILKSRPPDNRDPLKEEIAAHFPILVRQIELIQPKIILCAGRVAGNNLLGKSETMGKLREGFHEFMGIPVVVTYHPAALLRNEQWKRPTWEDVQKLRKKHDEIISSVSQ
jgi:uracil-DNA glycosylase family 4